MKIVELSPEIDYYGDSDDYDHELDVPKWQRVKL